MSWVVWIGGRSLAPEKAWGLATRRVAEKGDPLVPPLTSQAPLSVKMRRPAETGVADLIAFRVVEVSVAWIALSPCAGKVVLKLKIDPGCERLNWAGERTGPPRNIR